VAEALDRARSLYAETSNQHLAGVASDF